MRRKLLISELSSVDVPFPLPRDGRFCQLSEEYFSPSLFLERKKTRSLSRETSVHSSTGDAADPEASALPSPNWGRATTCFWPATFTVYRNSEDNSLQCVLTVQATTRQHSIFFAVRCTHRHAPPPTTSNQPILDACGPFWSRFGPWHPRPHQLEMRERADLLQTMRHFGADMRSRTSVPESHSAHPDTPVIASELGHEGWVHSLQPMPFFISRKGGWL